MTQRTRLALPRRPAEDADPLTEDTRPRRQPVRGSGSAPRKRPTAAEAQKAREQTRQQVQQPNEPPPGRAGAADDKRPAKPARRAHPGRTDDRPQHAGGGHRHDPRHRDAPRPAGRDRDEQRGERQTGRRAPAASPHASPARREAGEPFPDRRSANRRHRDDGSRPLAPAGPHRSHPPFRGEHPPLHDEGRSASRPSRPAGHKAAFAPAQRHAPAAAVPSRPASAAPALAAPGPDAGIRLSKRMSELGLASRREADEWIAQGWVRVDGQVVSELGSRVLPHQQITVDAAARQQQAQRVTVLLHKPIGYVSGQAEDGYTPAVALVTAENRWAGDRTAIRFSPVQRRHLAPAGRLDIDSTGLLVLTQDGRIAKLLIGEDSPIEKEYLVRVRLAAGQPEGAHASELLPPEALERLRHGLALDGVPLQPAKVSWQNEDQLRFVLREGRKRQIRRMCEAVGLDVVGLKRVRIGRIPLGDLPPGQWRYLRPDERF